MQPSISSRYYHQDYFDRRSSNFRHGHESFREAMFQSKTTSLQGKWSNDSFNQEKKSRQTAPLNNWKELSKAIDMHTTPRTKNECRKLFQRTHVNIVDLMATKGTGRRVPTYETVDELADYTKETGKFFPQRHAESQGPLVKSLLRPIHESGTNVQEEFSNGDCDRDSSQVDWDNDYDYDNCVGRDGDHDVDWNSDSEHDCDHEHEQEYDREYEHEHEHEHEFDHEYGYDDDDDYANADDYECDYDQDCDNDDYDDDDY